MLAWLLRHWLIAALLASAAMLLAAHAFERLGYAPCTLCFRQREVYWAAGAIAGAALLAQLAVRRALLFQAAAVLLGLAFLTGAVVAAYHAGVEWKFWPGPPTCAGGAGSLGPILDALDKPMRAARCDEAAWRLFGLSMAGYNALISTALAGFSFWAAAAPRPGEKDGRDD